MGTAQTKFFTYHQNNSGGSFYVDDNVGHYVIVEAVDAAHADARAELLGVYFAGCATGQDCSCCGDRWYSATESRGKSEPMIYDEPANAYKPGGLARLLGDRSIRIYRLDNTVERIEATP